MIAVTRFDVPEQQADSFGHGLRGLLELLGRSPGFVRGRVGRALDDPRSWVLSTEWDSVGSYRRGLGSYEVKVAGPPLMAYSVPDASAFEVVSSQDEARPPVGGPGDRAR